jgi:hypothetical protein
MLTGAVSPGLDMSRVAEGSLRMLIDMANAPEDPHINGFVHVHCPALTLQASGRDAP